MSPSITPAVRFSATQIADLLGRHRPTPEQIEVIEAPLEPVLVVAGAGSGKTETMAARVVYLIANGLVAPDGVLGLTFTRKAAGELSERIRARLRTLDARMGAWDSTRATALTLGGAGNPRLAGEPNGSGNGPDILAAMARPTVATYNSYAANLVKEHALRLGIEPGARLLGEASGWQLAHEVVESWTADLNTDSALSTVVTAVREVAGTLREHLLTGDEAREQMQAIIDAIAATPDGSGRSTPYADVTKLVGLMHERIGLLEVVGEYERRKQASETLDFADQVAYAARLAMGFGEVGAAEREKFPVVLLDEYQDTSYAQARMLGALFGAGHAVTAVGDPNQSIYGWRGASASGLSRFAEQFNNVATSRVEGSRAEASPDTDAPRENASDEVDSGEGSPGDGETGTQRGQRTQGGAGIVTRRLECPSVHNRELSTSWRNDVRILDVANRVAAPLRDIQVGLEVTELGARPGAGEGTVQAGYFGTLAEEASAVADFIAEHWRPAARESNRVTAAILCRARRQFLPLELALRAKGIPVEVVGLGGLLTSAEIVDLVALLQVVHDPSRGDALMRLLTGPRLNLGAADLFAMADRGRELAYRQTKRGVGQGESALATAEGSESVDGAPTLVRDSAGVPERAATPPSAPATSAREADLIDSHTIVDVLDDLPRRGWVSADGRTLSEVEHTRLEALAALLGQLRSRTYLSVPDLVSEAEAALGLDIEIAMGASTLGDRHRTRANLDAFTNVAISFVDGAQIPTLGAFLAWLEAAQAEERGLDQAVSEPDANAVQIITVHAAKGLEWDVVAVPGLVDGAFPSTAANGSEGPKDSAWLTGLGTVPYPLRGDALDLPDFAYAGADDHKDLKARLDTFRSDAGIYQVSEERRLAYVAFTRARTRLLLTGSWFRTAQKPASPSLFLTELVEAGLIDDGGFAPEPEEGVTNPALDEVTSATWPASPVESRAHAVDEAAASLVRAEIARLAGADAAPKDSAGARDAPASDGPARVDSREDSAPGAAPESGYARSLSQIADLLLAERDANRRPISEVAVPAHLSASAMVRMATDRDALALELRRPVPSKPSVHAYRGTVFHMWVERFFSAPSLVDFDDLPGEDAIEADLDLADLQAAFEASEWAALVPEAIEVDIETPVAGTSIRSRIDAVFRDPDNPDGYVVVDWKTGREPSDHITSRYKQSVL